MKVGDKIKLLVPWKADDDMGKATWELPAGTEGKVVEPPNEQQEFHHKEMILVEFSPGIQAYLFDPDNEVYEEVA